MSASTAIGYRPEAGSATRRSANAPSRPASSPIAAPAASSYTTIPAMSAGPGACALVPLSSVTASTAGGSLSPDSASSVPDSWGGSGSLRRTENTAAASVGASTAPSRKASRQPSDSSQWDTSATTRMLTATPTVARMSAAGAAARACSQLVVRPPSARISTSALSPSAWASSALSNRTPRPASPRARPRPRKRRSPGRPIPCATRAATIAAITTTAPTSRIRLGSPAFNAASAWPYPGPELVVNSLPDQRSRPRGPRRSAVAYVPPLSPARRAFSSLLAVEEQRDGLVDSPLAGVGALGRVDVVDVIPLHAVRQLLEEGFGPLIGRQRGGEVGRDVHLTGSVGDGQSHADRVPALESGGVADGGADADQVPAAPHGDRVPVSVTVHVDQHGRALARRELLDDLRRHLDPGVVAARGDSCLERHTLGRSCHLPSPPLPARPA